MATVTVVDPVALNSTANGTSYVSNSFTPAAGDLVVVFVYAATTSSTSTLSSSDGLTFSDIDQNTGTGISLYSFVSNEFANNVSQTVTFDCTGENADAVVIEVFLISGATNNGADAIRQFARVVSGGGGATVRTTFSASALSTSVILTCVGSGDDTPGLTDPSGFTRGHETITSTPADSATSAYQASGFTGTQVTFGGTFGSSWKMTSVEIMPTTPLSIAADAASFAVTGAAVTLNRGRKIVAAAASFALTATAVSVELGREVAADTASFAFTAQSASPRYGREIAVDAASFVETGTAVSLELGYEVAVAAASFAATGQAVSLEYGREVNADPASFSLTAADVTYVYGPSSGRLLILEPASFGFSGAAVAVERGYEIAVQAASFALSGQAVSLEFGREVMALAANFTASAASVALEYGREVAAAGASFGYSGANTSVAQGIRISLGGESFGFDTEEVTFDYQTAVQPYPPPEPRKPGSRFSDRRFNEGGFRPLRK